MSYKDYIKIYKEIRWKDTRQWGWLLEEFFSLWLLYKYEWISVLLKIGKVNIVNIFFFLVISDKPFRAYHSTQTLLFNFSIISKFWYLNSLHPYKNTDFIANKLILKFFHRTKVKWILLWNLSIFNKMFIRKVPLLLELKLSQHL